MTNAPSSTTISVDTMRAPISGDVSTIQAVSTINRFAPSTFCSSGIASMARSQPGTRSPTSGLVADPTSGIGSIVVISFYHERRHHPEHPVVGFGVRQNVTVKRPRSGVVAIHDGIPALAGRHVERVALPR